MEMHWCSWFPPEHEIEILRRLRLCVSRNGATSVCMWLKSLQDLFVDELKDLYSAETQIIKALPKMAKAASSSELKEAFQQHLEQTKDHVQRLEQICDKLDLNPKGKKCKAMQGLLEE